VVRELDQDTTGQRTGTDSSHTRCATKMFCHPLDQRGVPIQSRDGDTRPSHLSIALLDGRRRRPWGCIAAIGLPRQTWNRRQYGPDIGQCRVEAHHYIGSQPVGPRADNPAKLLEALFEITLSPARPLGQVDTNATGNGMQYLGRLKRGHTHGSPR